MIASAQILALGGAAALVLGFGTGWKVRDWKADAAALAALEDADWERDRRQLQLEIQATRYEQERADAVPRHVEREQAIRTIWRERPVAGACAVPDAARQLLDEAVADANARAAGQPGAAVPGPAEPARAAARP